jgi:hypothetical protein
MLLCPALVFADSYAPPPDGLRHVGVVDVFAFSNCGYNDVDLALKRMVLEIQKQLSLHGIRIAPVDTALTSQSATLVIDVSCSQLGVAKGHPAIWLAPYGSGLLGTGRLIYHPRVSLERQVQIGTSTSVIAETWSRAGELEVAQGPELTKLQSTVKGLVNDFISDYEAVNRVPSASPPG